VVASGMSPEPGSRPLIPATPGAAPVSRRRTLVTFCLLGGSGLVLVVAGSFLPWVISGTVSRSSYVIVGVADRLGIGADGAIGLLIALWPLVGVLCMAPVVAGCVRWWRTAGAIAVVVGVASGLLSFGILLVTVGRVGLSVRLDPIGPAVMAAGSVVLVGAGAALALGVGSPGRR
jgi:hypothetical protein